MSSQPISTKPVLKTQDTGDTKNCVKTQKFPKFVFLENPISPVSDIDDERTQIRPTQKAKRKNSSATQTTTKQTKSQTQTIEIKSQHQDVDSETELTSNRYTV